MLSFSELVAQRNYYETKSEELWQILVMIKRELDKHETKEEFLQLPSSAWDEVIKRANKYQSHYLI